MSKCRKTLQDAQSCLFILQLKPRATKPVVRGSLYEMKGSLFISKPANNEVIQLKMAVFGFSAPCGQVELFLHHKFYSFTVFTFFHSD